MESLYLTGCISYMAWVRYYLFAIKILETAIIISFVEFILKVCAIVVYLSFDQHSSGLGQ